MTSRTLIVSADDFGFSESINEAVLCASEFGTLGAASLMVNMPFADAAVAAAKRRTPKMSLGLHFTLTSGFSVAPADSIPLLADAGGRFLNGFGGIFKLMWGFNSKEACRQIRREFDAQLAEADRLADKHGVVFDHLDTHQHVHVLPGIRGMLLDEAERRKWMLRIPRERLGGFRRVFRRGVSWGPIGVLKRDVLKFSLPWNVRGLDYFGILDTGKMDANAWNAILDVMNRPIAEVNVHPSLDPGADESTWRCSEADRIFHRSVWRRREFDLLMDKAFRDQILTRNIQFGTFAFNESGPVVPTPTLSEQ